MPKNGLFPVNIVSCDPANLGSVDADLVGMGDDGHEYVIKTVEKTPSVPASEWVCHRLAEACHIVVPQYAIVNVPGKNPAFGSRWDGSREQNPATLMEIYLGQKSVNLMSERLSAIFAFDLFVHNDDRHRGNYMFNAVRNGGYAVRAYDFSRAWLHHGWPLPKLPLPPCNTLNEFRMLMTHHKFDLKAANAALDHLAQVGGDEMRGILDEIPKEWLDAPRRVEMANWWNDGSKDDRIEIIRGGLNNGTLL